MLHHDNKVKDLLWLPITTETLQVLVGQPKYKVPTSLTELISFFVSTDTEEVSLKV
jgi:hypothetical protein